MNITSATYVIDYHTVSFTRVAFGVLHITVTDPKGNDSTYRVAKDHPKHVTANLIMRSIYNQVDPAKVDALADAMVPFFD